MSAEQATEAMRSGRRRGGRANARRRAVPAAPDAHVEAAIPSRPRTRPAGVRTRIIACGALAREIGALQRGNDWQHLDLVCLPATLHNTPDAIPEAVRQRVREARADGIEIILVAYGDCGTGGRLDRVCEEEGVERINGPHCYAFFDGLDAFAARSEEEIGAFYLTDFLVRQFETLVWRGLGLDRGPELREMMFAHYDRVVFLAQTEDADLTRRAEDAARRLGLPLERRFTGFGGLASALATVASR
ncbi:MAG: DUF1638 domain-containing protein [Pseudomonadota bacterium]